MTCWVVTPIKAPADCKTRLRPALSDVARRDLVDSMLRHVVSVAAGTPGVDEVLGVNLFSRGADGEWHRVPQGADRAAGVVLRAWQLPEVQGLVVLDGDAPDRLDTGATDAGDEVAVPVVPERC